MRWAHWIVAAASGVSMAALAAPASAATKPAVPASATNAPATDRVATCSWDRPGHNPFMGDVVAAVDRYADIPAPVRERLKQRMRSRSYDDLVEIRRDSIRGRQAYRSEIRDMHFGLNRVCSQVKRTGWSAAMAERGLVYCEAGHCILVPTVCRNVSRIERRPQQVAGDVVGGGEPEALLPSGTLVAFDGLPAALDALKVPAPLAVLPIASLPAEPTPLTAGPSFADEAVAVAPPPLPPGPPGGTGVNPPPTMPPPMFERDTVAIVPPARELVVTPVPEPSTWAMLAGGLALLVLRARRLQRRAGVPRIATQ